MTAASFPAYTPPTPTRPEVDGSLVSHGKNAVKAEPKSLSAPWKKKEPGSGALTVSPLHATPDGDVQATCVTVWLGLKERVTAVAPGA